MLNKLILCPSFVLILLLSTFTVQAQQYAYKAWMGHIEGGAAFYEIGELNTILEQDSGYSPFPNALFTLGFGMDRVNKNWVYGASGYAFIYSAPGLRQASFKVAILNYYYAYLKLGYVAYQTETEGGPLLIYPSVGLGGGVALLRTSPYGLSVYNRFSDVGVMGDAALNLVHYPPVRNNDKFDLELGASIGYYFDISETWKLSKFVPGRDISVGPQGFYLRLVIGMGKVRRL